MARAPKRKTAAKPRQQGGLYIRIPGFSAFGRGGVFSPLRILFAVLGMGIAIGYYAIDKGYDPLSKAGLSSIFKAQSPSLPPSDVFIKPNQIRSCFTPYQKCGSLVVKAISRAKKSIFVQSYSFTSKDIANALILARKRGVKIIVVADKSQKKAPHTQTRKLKKFGIPVLLDTKPAIAHNKVMIIDEKVVITGSYNWTNAAEKRNTENLLFIYNVVLAKQYLNNFNRRKKVSVRM